MVQPFQAWAVLVFYPTPGPVSFAWAFACNTPFSYPLTLSPSLPLTSISLSWEFQHAHVYVHACNMAWKFKFSCMHICHHSCLSLLLCCMYLHTPEKEKGRHFLRALTLENRHGTFLDSCGTQFLFSGDSFFSSCIYHPSTNIVQTGRRGMSGNREVNNGGGCLVFCGVVDGDRQAAWQRHARPP